MEFTEKLRLLSNLLCNLKLNIRQGSNGLIVEDEITESGYLINDKQIDSKTLESIKLNNLVIFN